MALPTDYMERVYAGVLGKIIGVYLGRPFEGWHYEPIMEHLGEINYYVHERFGDQLIVPDDDISGTFSFLRALPDNGNSQNVTAEQIGQAWLNYLIEGRTVLWWGGLGNSTEHTAYLRLKSGIPAPMSGSIATNGKVVAEQIGSQIFIDGWALVSPGDPEQAAQLARKAGSVSHDGEAIYGAQVLAAMEAQAFVENDINVLIDTAVSFIPQDSVIARMISDIREWHEDVPNWHDARSLMKEHYGYDKYGGNCHMVPNHGLIIMSLLYGEDDFQKSLMIVNTSGWDTDCNSGNVGCLLGIKNGLAGLETGPDFRGPVADRMYMPSAETGTTITDALRESVKVVNIGRALQGEPPLAPKNGARYHFSLPGSVHGFMLEDSEESSGTAMVANVETTDGRGLGICFSRLAPGRVARVTTPTFIPSKEVNEIFDSAKSYRLLSSPTLGPGQCVRARVLADANNEGSVNMCLVAQHYDLGDERTSIGSESLALAPGADAELCWIVPDTGGQPICAIGVEISGAGGVSGKVVLDWLTWDGVPNVVLKNPHKGPTRQSRQHLSLMWKRAWVDALDSGNSDRYPEFFRLIQNEGRGLVLHGTREWEDYRFRATMTPHMCESGGIAVRVQGLRRYYALLLDQERVRLVRMLNGDETVLAEVAGGWSFGETSDLQLAVEGDRLLGSIDGKPVIEVSDTDGALVSGGVALVCEEGRIGCSEVGISPLQN